MSDQVDEAAPPAAVLTRSQELLLNFLSDHDADCPVCGYNLKALTRPVCPECRQDLELTVGATRLRIGWLFAAVAPGFFSGVAAVFGLIPILGRFIFGDGVLMSLLVPVDLFGWCSGIFAIMLARKRFRVRFLARPLAQQRLFAIIVWIIHFAALGGFMLIGWVYF
jgi:hypothetical protein